VIVSSDAPLDGMGISDSIISTSTSGITVLEVGKSGIPAPADAGTDKVFVDAQMGGITY